MCDDDIKALKDEVLGLMLQIMRLFGVIAFEYDENTEHWIATYPYGVVVSWTVDLPFGATPEEQERWARQFTYRWGLAHNLTHPAMQVDTEKYSD